jgi:hypothetical protein
MESRKLQMMVPKHLGMRTKKARQGLGNSDQVDFLVAGFAYFGTDTY